MDENVFSHFSGFDFLFVGVLSTLIFDRWTVIMLLLIYIFLTNRKIAGIESRQILIYIYSLVKSFLPKESEPKEGQKKRGRKRKS